MKNKLLTFFMTAIVCLTTPSLSAETYNGTCGENLTWTLDTETGVLTISGTGEMYNYSNYFWDYAPWKDYSDYLITIILTDGVTTIGDHAFYNCRSLTSVTIPNSVTTIGDYAFYNCSSLTSVTIPNSVTSIGGQAFYGCSSLTSVTIPNSVTSIEYYAFYGCSSLTSVTIPNSVEWIGTDAFGGVINIIYNGSATGSPWGAQYVNAYPEGYFLYSDDTKTSILKCFSYAEGEISIPSSVTSIENEAFRGCANITTVTIPNTVTNIGDDAFSGVLNVVYNGTATGSPWGASYVNCFVDGYLVYGDKTKTTLVGCLKNVKGEVTIPNSVTSIGNQAFSSCTAMTSVTIPNSVTSIGNQAFIYCINLTSITIPNSVTSIGWAAFDDCQSLPVIDNIRYADTYLVEVVDGTLSSYTIQKGTRWIGDNAFSGCSSLTSIEIPNNVTSIGYDAFYNCSSLTSIEIPNSVTNIGDFAFSDCSSLTSIEIPNSVTSIGDYTFSSCSSLTSIEIPNSVTSIGRDAFENCSSLTAVHISDLAAWCAIEFGKYEDWGYVVYSAMANPLYYAKHLFLNGNEITELEIPEGITAINPYAFINAGSLTSVRIPQSVTAIGQGAFSGCSAVKRIYCDAVTPPAVESESFANYNAYLYVPCANFEDYDLHDVWGSFKHIECLPEDATALDDSMTDPQSSQAKKIFRNGTICIEHDGILYNLQGTIIR